MNPDAVARPPGAADDARDVVVIGAGQAGLATGYYLSRARIDVQLLEREQHVGTSWARRWDSLRLFTPVRYDALPGAAFPGKAWSFPGKDDVAAYLANYAKRFALPVRTEAEVVELTGRPGRFTIHLADGETITARRVVVATGAFGRPYTPALAAGLDRQVVQVHSEDYRSPDQLPGGAVLVVGGGNSGFQIALELADTARAVHLAEGTPLSTIARAVTARALFWRLSNRVIHAPDETFLGRRLRANEPVMGTTRRTLRRAGVTLRPRAVSGAGRTVTFADGERLNPAAVVWATGYRHDDRWVTIPGALDTAGALVTNDASTPISGLYTIGRLWQHDRGSALLGHVSCDAERLAQRLTPATATQADKIGGSASPKPQRQE